MRSALAADGSLVESNPASLARWGYELYDGSVLSTASLRAMTDFDDNEGQFYGLGVFDMSSENAFVDEGFGRPAIGHDGIGAGIGRDTRRIPSNGRGRLGADPGQRPERAQDVDRRPAGCGSSGRDRLASESM